jgi:acyl-ACP thioesterase
MLLDLETRRPVRVDEQLPDLPLVTEYSYELHFRVRHGDVDLNRHVNNVVYVDWALETLSPEMIGKLRPYSVEISCQAESYYGDRIFSCSQFISQEPPITLHQMVSEKSGREVARLRMEWQSL